MEKVMEHLLHRFDAIEGDGAAVVRREGPYVADGRRLKGPRLTRRRRGADDLEGEPERTVDIRAPVARRRLREGYPPILAEENGAIGAVAHQIRESLLRVAIPIQRRGFFTPVRLHARPDQTELRAIRLADAALRRRRLRGNRLVHEPEDEGEIGRAHV